MNISIEELQINPRIVAAIRRGLGNIEAILSLPKAELERLTGLTSFDINQLKDAVSEVVLKHIPITAYQIWKKECTDDLLMLKLSTGCAVLDKYLRGGILTKGITEIVGESATGKTQLCLQLCITVQMPLEQGGLDGGAVYVCTEDAFPSKRLLQLVQQFSSKYSCTQDESRCIPRITDHIYIEHVADFDGLNICLQKKLPLLLARGSVRLVIIDSVAALFRCHYDNNNMLTRAKHLASLATHLRKLAIQHSASVVCVNQVSANMSGTADGDGQIRQSIPALGLAWADHVTCRFLMSYYQQMPHNSQQNLISNDVTLDTGVGLATLRQLEIVFAPHLPQSSMPLIITNQGVRCPG